MTQALECSVVERGSDRSFDDPAILHERLKNHICRYESLMVAYSGGVDSALVASVAHEVLGSRVIAVTADSPSLARSELKSAKQFANKVGIRHVVIRTAEMQDPRYLENPSNRCYFCKSELYSRLLPLAQREQIRHIANGTNLDDLGDYRPGLQAADEYRVVSPLRDTKMTKKAVRSLAKFLTLPVADKPASPCLSSRIPYGSAVTPEKLAAIEAAEACLKKLGVTEVRVRHFGVRARIEANVSDFDRIRADWNGIQDGLQSLGFKEIELQRFQSGALNQLADLHLNLSSPCSDGPRQD